MLYLIFIYFLVYAGCCVYKTLAGISDDISDISSTRPYGKISSNYMRNHMFINDINDFLIIFDDLIYFSLN